MDESAFGGDSVPGTMSGGNTEFGSGLDFGGGAAAAPGVDKGTDELPVNARATEGELGTNTIDVKGFGRGLTRIMGAPDYRAPDPALSALDQTADTLQQRIKRANDIAANPMLQFFSP